MARNVSKLALAAGCALLAGAAITPLRAGVAAVARGLTPDSVADRAVLSTDPTPCSASITDTETWTPAGHPEKAQVTHGRVLFYKSVELEEDVDRNGKPLKDSDRAREQSEVKRLEKAIDQAWHGAGDNGRLVTIGDEVWKVPVLLKAYEFADDGPGEFHGRKVEIFRFWPRPGVHPSSRVERGLMSMEGRAWLLSDGQLVRVEFHNRVPVRFGWGLLANFTSVSGSMDMQPFANTWVRGRVELHLNGRELFTRLNGTLVKSYQISGSQSAERASSRTSGTSAARKS